LSVATHPTVSTSNKKKVKNGIVYGASLCDFQAD